MLKTYSIHDRENKVHTKDFGTTKSFPNFLAAKDFNEAIEAIVRAHKNGKKVIVAMGAHVVKTGCSPYIIDLIEKKVISAIVVNGAFAIHDVEIAFFGKTSEDVDKNILDGTFGYAEETPRIFSDIAEGIKNRYNSFGFETGQVINYDAIFKKYSVIGAAHRNGIPVGIFIAIGTDTIHLHPSVDVAALARGSMEDFWKIQHEVYNLEDGVWINIGSAVILPEVFLKLISGARNSSHKLSNVTAINFDMVNHYRTSKNVLSRPVARGYSFIGHHEIMLPIFYWALTERLKNA